MLFSSSIFLFLFLPTVLLGFYSLRRIFGFRVATYFLTLASLFFYAYWNPYYLILILGSVAANLLLAQQMVGRSAETPPSRRWLVAGILFNLALLGYYKYSIFIANSVLSLVSDVPLFLQITLPLAISFFTFQQVAFLVDAYKDPGLLSSTRWDSYLLFVTFFPQLIAGPIVHHKALVPQLNRDTLGNVSTHMVALGVCVFLLGLFKKAVLADQLAQLSGPVFEKLATGADLAAVEAWLGILVYTFRLYFDFSGYSDMAFGLGLLFGVILPINFFSPYRAGNINETWARWNITLGNFFGNYVFKPLGGRKRGHLLTMRNLMIIMLLSGVWHGAGWNYLLWGVMQGAAMAVAYVWPYVLLAIGLAAWREQVWYSKYLAVFLTFSFWVFSLVAFRVTNTDDIWRFYDAMFSLDWTALSGLGERFKGQLGQLMNAFGGDASFHLSGESLSLLALLICFPLIFGAPNVFQFFGITRNGRIGRASVNIWQALWVGLLAAFAIAQVINGTANEFIYFAF